MERPHITIRPCSFQENEQRIATYYHENQVILDNLLEDYIREGSHYQFCQEGQVVGYFALYEREMLVCFAVVPWLGHLAQELFARARTYEQCRMATVPTGDEFFMSLALDTYSRLEKQAYFAIYTDRVDSKTMPQIQLEEADIQRDQALLAQEPEFLEKKICKIKKGSTRQKIYLAKHEGELVGFGNLELSTLTNYASNGMLVLPAHRQKGYGTAILVALKEKAREYGQEPISGCWYYNHNSKKSMEAAGAYSRTRLLNFYF